jgi:predicted ATP-grasp superfamily ATP-dependent carboligase
MNKKRILLTTSHWTSARAILESLGKQGHELLLIDDRPHGPRAETFFSKYCTKSFLCEAKGANKANYVDFVLNILRKENIDLFIPICDRDVEYFSEIEDEVRRHAHMVLASRKLIDLAGNKDKTYRFCMEHGFNIPKTYFPVSMEEISQLADQITYPCLAKAAKATANEGNTYFQTKEGLLGFYKNFAGKPIWPVLQEFIHGDVASFSAVCDQGKVLGHFMMHIEYKHSIGAPAVARSTNDPALLDLSTRIIRKLEWTGAINFDLIREPQGEYKLMEINPRFGGSICLAYRLGVDLPLILYSLAFDQQPLYKTDYADGWILRDLFPTELVYCIQDRKHIPLFFKNFFVSRSVIDMNWGDPGLLLAMIRNSFIEMKGEFVRRSRLKAGESKI